MPSDNLENLFKQKVTEGQHTPPPFSWDQEAVWQKLHPTLQPNQEKRVGKFYYGVAAVIMLLISAALSLILLKNQSAEDLVATRNKVEKPVPATTLQPTQNITKPKPDAKLESGNYAANSLKNSVNKEPVQKNRQVAKQQRVVHKTEVKSNNADEVFTDLPKIELANDLENEQVAAVTPIAKPIKITIVLGARSIAKIDSVGKKTRTVAKNKLRLKMNLPGAEAVEYNSMATNNSYPKPLTWETKIKL